MNKLLTSFPLVILTGAGASKWLGKATTYDVYDSREFQERCGVAPFNILGDMHNHLQGQKETDPVDLEFLLDHMQDVITKFDALHSNPHFGPVMAPGVGLRDQYHEAYEQALDFMVDYYGNVDSRAAVALYEPFFEGLQRIAATSVIPLFTLNYDDAVESATDELADYGLVDGFRSGHRPVWSRGKFDNYSPAANGTDIALFKLHGSVSWTRADGSDRIEKTVSVPRRGRGRTQVIRYPTQLRKPVNEEPFATAYGYFEAALATARVAVFIGTSFRDRELLEVIRRALDRRKSHTLIAVGPEVKRGDVASRIGLPRDRVRAVSMSFEPEQIPRLFKEIKVQLSVGG